MRKIEKRLEILRLLLADLEKNSGTVTISYNAGLWTMAIVTKTGPDDLSVSGFSVDSDFDEVLDEVQEELRS